MEFATPVRNQLELAVQRAFAIRKPIVARLALLGVVLCASRCLAIDITVTGDWLFTSSAGDLVAGAGTDLPNAYESDMAQAALTVSNTTGDTDNWRIDVRRSDTNWLAGLALFVRRTGDAVGGGSISGGISYLEVTSSDSAFISGSGDRVGIDVQLKVSGTSISIAPDTYSTLIVYKVVDTS